MSGSTSREKRGPALAVIVTLLAAASWGLITVLTIVAYLRDGLVPISDFSRTTVNVFALMHLMLTASAWLLTRPDRGQQILQVACTIMRIVACTMLAVAAFAIVLDIGPDAPKERATASEVFSSFTILLVGIGIPVWVNVMQPLVSARQRSSRSRA